MTGDRRVRVHIIGVVVTALFCSLLARMWFLQVRETPTAIHMAGQSSRTIRTPTSRGLIYDSAGRLLVGNRLAWAISGDAVLRAAAHDSPERKIVPGIAKLVGMTERNVTVALDKKFVGPLESVVLKTGINEAVRIQLVEHADEYPHVQLAAIASRWYADPGIAPQVLGYLGRVNEDDLKKHSEYGRNEVIGRSGLEAVYESLLRGDPSSFDVQVDARGLVVGDPIHVWNRPLELERHCSDGVLNLGVVGHRTAQSSDGRALMTPRDGQITRAFRDAEIDIAEGRLGPGEN